MEGINSAYNKFVKSYEALDRSLSFFSSGKYSFTTEEKETLVAGLIKHFELSYEMGWKFLQQYLKHKYEINLASPKAIFRECFAQKIVDYDTTEELLNMSNARNQTTHDYNEETAQETIGRVAHYYMVLEKLKKLYS
jgi:nucleotidyltransferase substrate binding protein (TIGR01987 family)